LKDVSGSLQEWDFKRFFRADTEKSHEFVFNKEKRKRYTVKYFANWRV